MITNENNSLPYMKSLAACLNHMAAAGYSEDFLVTEEGLIAKHSQQIYAPGQVKVVNFFRFEGESDPADNAILYIIETTDGLKGTLVDAYGIYDDMLVTDFMRDVQQIQKE